MADGRWHMVDSTKISSFEQLDVWNQAQTVAVSMYKLTKIFPEDEKFGLTSQLRRASSSISANIAEGFGRHSQKDKLYFYAIAYGSLLEVRSFLYLANKLSFIDSAELQKGLAETETCQKLLNSLMSAIRKKL